MARFDFLIPIVVVGIITAGIYGLFELFVRRKERMAIIEKLGDNLNLPQLPSSYILGYGMPKISFNALKVGCLLMGIGFGILVGFILNIIVSANKHYLEITRDYELLTSAYSASVLLFGGLGLILAFILEMKIGKKDKK